VTDVLYWITNSGVVIECSVENFLGNFYTRISMERGDSWILADEVG